MARVKCTTCGREQTTDGTAAIQHGWPTCCGTTMRLVATNDPDELTQGVDAAFAPARAAMEATRRA